VKNAKGTVQILNPRGTPPPITLIPMAPRPETLDGKTIYIVDVNFPLTEPFYKAALKLLREKLPKIHWEVKSKVGSFFEDDPALWAEIKEKAQGAIVGPGHLDTLGPAVVGWCATLEKMGVPAVPLICAVYPGLEKKVAFERGMPNMRLIFIPYEVVGTSEEVCRKILAGNDPITRKPVLREIVDVLTQQPTAEEKETGTMNRLGPRVLEPNTPEYLQRYINKMGWTDFYPVILPTEEKVAAMLKGTSRKPDEIVGRMFPSSPHEAWEYNVEQVAVNAVMAGARPEHFPVILAIAATGQTALWSSVTSQTRMVVVNGPIRNEIKMNSGLGAMGPFNEANAVIGRSWTFISKNLGGGGGEPGLTYLGAFGNSANYNNLCFAENEEGLPRGWKALHVMKGFKSKESTVSLFAGFGIVPDATLTVGPHHVAIKRQLIGLNAFAMKMFYRGVRFGMRAVLFITPKAASLLVEEGFKSKEALFQWLKENTFLEEKAESPEMQLDIIVVGGVIQAYQPGNLYYNTTASIDQWR
jgi:hypothetical protein